MVTQPEALMITDSDVNLVLMPTMNLAIAKQRLHEFQQFVAECMVEGEDYGTIPSTPKPTLYKPGADKLCELYGLSDSYTILAKTEDFDRGLFDYTVECCLTSRRSNQFISSGLGCCSTWESKYRWRNASRKCPTCGKEAIIKGKADWGGGWICYKKKDGCGAKFAENDTAITSQEVGRVDNPDIIDLKNTALKMAKKRAKIDATLSATRSSGIFTQDMEDIKQAAPEAGEVGTDAEPHPERIAGVILREALGEKSFWYALQVKHGNDLAEVKVQSPKETDSGRLADKVGWLVELDVIPARKNGIPIPDTFQLVGVAGVHRPQGEKQAATPAEKPYNAPSGQPEAKTGHPSEISEPQRKRLFAIAKEHGWPESALRDLVGRYGFEHIHEITKDQYGTIVAEIEGSPK